MSEAAEYVCGEGEKSKYDSGYFFFYNSILGPDFSHKFCSHFRKIEVVADIIIIIDKVKLIEPQILKIGEKVIV
jgi:hypothetical protein